MPEHDGTGPKGRGPMTGRGRGHCKLKIPQISNEPLTGFAGRSGQPVRIWLHGLELIELEQIGKACCDRDRRCGRLKRELHGGADVQPQFEGRTLGYKGLEDYVLNADVNLVEKTLVDNPADHAGK